MDYDHSLQEHRVKLAKSITGLLISLGFKRDNKIKAKEHVYSRMLKSNMKISVYTSASEHQNILQVRDVGQDAVRIAVLYHTKNGDIRPVGRKTRINRTGEFKAILERLRDRTIDIMKEPTTHCEHCEAPQFKSKGGNMVCAELCWTKPDYKPKPVKMPEWKVGHGSCSRCGADNWKSKAGNVYCSKVCWKNN